MKKDYTDLLLEEIREQNKALLEGQRQMLGIPKKVDKLSTDMTEVKADLKTIKKAVTETNKDQRRLDKQVDDHAKRITKLEHKLA